MSDSQKYLDKDYRVRLYLASRNALYWPLKGSDDEFEPANVEYLSTSTRAFVRLAHPKAVEAILLEMDRLAKLDEENKQLRKRAADAELAYNNLTMECRRLNEENAQLYAQQDVARDTYEALVAENQQLRAALDETIATLAMAENGLKEFDGRITRLEKITKETDAEIVRLQGRESYIAMLEEDLDEVLDQVDADIEEIDRLKQENERLANAAESMVVDYGQLQLQLEAQKETALAMIQQREDSITKHIQENAELRAQLAEKDRLLNIYETKYVTKTSLDIMTKGYKVACAENERLKKELTAERATNFGEGAWVAVEAYNKVAHALAEVSDIAERWIREDAMPAGTNDFKRLRELRSVGEECHFPSFELAWALMEARGYQYGQDALEQVRLGYELAHRWLQHLGEP